MRFHHGSSAMALVIHKGSLPRDDLSRVVCSNTLCITSPLLISRVYVQRNSIKRSSVRIRILYTPIRHRWPWCTAAFESFMARPNKRNAIIVTGTEATTHKSFYMPAHPSFGFPPPLFIVFFPFFLLRPSPRRLGRRNPPA